MNNFPRTSIGGISVSRMVVGTNWFLGYSHTSAAKDEFIKTYQTRNRIADVLEVFLHAGIDTVMGPLNPLLQEGVQEAQQRSGMKVNMMLTPWFKVNQGDPAQEEPEFVISECQKMGATFCMPHQQVTDALLDRTTRKIREIENITKMIRQYGMTPGLSTHLPETVIFCDENDYDVETYIQIYNAAGFMMPIEVEWQLDIIQKSKKPVTTIKPLAAGRLTPLVGLCFAWNTLREQDLVTVGTTTPEEAKEVIDLSMDFLERRQPENRLPITRSKSIFLGK